ncbi:hypothetical protein BV898_08790 [Hypsibius exemplaris]|uniref:Uncharacterized protein n=1 Tax=Hypsibius exemplaris TaxID=2072580 RepID=A0A1W0WPJ9_HYPEX|nr:hypothetical protein BV898_08790 [Hypsibius exemplaris]
MNNSTATLLLAENDTNYHTAAFRTTLKVLAPLKVILALFGALGNGLLLTASFNVYRSASPAIGRSANVHILIMQMAAGWLISGLGFLLDDSLVFGSILGHSPSLSVCLASYLTVGAICLACGRS